MSPWMVAVALKPFFLLAMFLPGAIAVWWIRKKMPDCALKRFLLISWKV